MSAETPPPQWLVLALRGGGALAGLLAILLVAAGLPVRIPLMMGALALGAILAAWLVGRPAGSRAPRGLPGRLVAFLFLLGWAGMLLEGHAHGRSLAYTLLYVGLACLAALVACTASRPAAAVGMALFLAGASRAQVILGAPGLVGASDPWFHERVAEVAYQSGHIPASGPLLSQYSVLGSAYAADVVARAVLAVSPKLALVFALCVPGLLSIMFVFLAGRALAGPRVGALAALLVSGYEYFVDRTTVLQPMTLGYVLFVIVLALALAPRRARVAAAVAMAAIILTHPLATAMALVILVAVLVQTAATRRSQARAPWGAPLVLASLSAVFAVWAYVRLLDQGSLKAPLLDYTIRGLLLAKAGLTQVQGVYLDAAAVPLASTVLSILDDAILLCLALAGGVVLLARRQGMTHLALILCAAAFSAVLAISLVGGNFLFVPERWFLPTGTLLSVLAAIALTRALGSARGAAVACAAMVGLVTFVGAVSPQTNFEHPLYGQEGQVRTRLLPSELSPLAFSQAHLADGLKVDGVLYAPAIFGHQVNASAITFQEARSPAVLAPGEAILARGEMREGRFYNTVGGVFTYAFSPSFFDPLDAGRLDRMYDSGSSQVLVTAPRGPT